MLMQPRATFADMPNMPDSKPVCQNCGAEASVMTGHVESGTWVSEWVCLACRTTWPRIDLSTESR